MQPSQSVDKSWIAPTVESICQFLVILALVTGGVVCKINVAKHESEVEIAKIKAGTR